VSSFIGRDAELSEVSRLMAASRLMTLTGSGGAGKTRLGLQLAAMLLDGSGDGVWFADLAPLEDPDLVAVTFANVLGVRAELGRPVIDTLADAVGRRSLLVLLDNCARHRGVRQARGRLAPALPEHRAARHQP
jgi:predicted ATPase